MQTNIIVLCKNNLVGTDAILPVLMEIKKHHPKVNIIFVFPSKENFDLVKRNYNLWEAIESMDASTYIRGSGNKVKALFWVMKAILFLCFLRRKNVFLKMQDFIPYHNFFMNIVKKLTDTIEIKYWVTYPMAEFAFTGAYISAKLTHERKGKTYKPTYFDGEYDFFLSTISQVSAFRYSAIFSAANLVFPVLE